MWEALPPFTVLGIDEIALKKGHRDYVVIVTARLSTGRLIVLAVLPDRTKATLVTWLTTIPAPTPSARSGRCAPICGTPTSRLYVRSCLMPRS